MIASATQALTISVAPPTQDVAVPGPATVSLTADFGGEQSIGGGFIIDLSGPISLVSFTPSAYFNTLDTAPGSDSDFTGYGTSNKPASAEFEIHFGSFSGITGANTLGDLTFNLTGTGVGVIDLSVSPANFYGGFLNLEGGPIATTFNDGEINAVPLPATAWLFATGLGLVGFRRRRRG